MIRAWEEHGPEYFSRIQKSIITQAARMLAPGGMLLYSTCTFDPEENEKQSSIFFVNIPNSRSVISGHTPDFLLVFRKNPTVKTRIFPELYGSFLTGWRERGTIWRC